MDIGRLNSALSPPRETLADEALHMLGAGYMVADVSVPCPVAGVLSLFDILDLPWIRGREPALMEVKAAMVIMEMRRDAVGLVMEAATSPEPVSHVAALSPHIVTDEELALLGNAITESMSIAATGFNFFPKDTPEEHESLSFGAEFLAAVCRVFGELGVSPEVALWEEPLARVGFLMAAVARGNGMKNIGRENTLDWGKAWEAVKHVD